MKSKILVTGSAGFIGTKLVKKLESEYNIVGYDLLEGNDVRDKYKLDDLFQKENFDTIIHLSARAGVRMGEEYPEEFISTNINGTLNLTKMAKKYNIKHFIFFSSSAVYGEHPSPNKETDELQQIGVYGASKAMGETLVTSCGVPYTIIRPFTVYGENGRLDQVIFKWIEQIKADIPITIFGDGSSKRGYTYVHDLIDGVKKVVELGAENETYNLGGNEIISLSQLVELFKPYTDNFKYLPLPKEDIPENWGDISKAERIGFKPTQDFVKNVTNILKEEFSKTTI